jgi:hypothetical protein
LVISDNDIDQGSFRGIKFNQDFGAGTITHATVTYNSIRHFGADGDPARSQGIFVQNPADTGSSVPTLASSIIAGNAVQDTGKDHTGVGIFVDSGNSGNLLTENNVRGSKFLDCQDMSAGSGTSGTGNTWFHNIGGSSSPSGLCSQH